MRTTLRRSCNACAKAKHRCDLQNPRCSRCLKRKSSCVYANEPLSSSSSNLHEAPSRAAGESSSDPRKSSELSSITLVNRRVTARCPERSVGLRDNPANGSFDPFVSYPPTRLSHDKVQRLIHHFLTSIAFQYYPLDLSTESNPFLVSWWPRALEDPALFHVSLQTASLDEEVRAQKGFPISEVLMADSVSLVRRKIEDSSLAFQDETLNSVVTLAAIEHGKGNISASRMHIDGVKRMVGIRGGIDKVKDTSPLTARMVSWVSLLVTGFPQFQTQDDNAVGTGIASIPQWQFVPTGSGIKAIDHLDINPIMGNIFLRLRSIFHDQEFSPLTNMELHDLTCFVIHRLLTIPPFSPAELMRSELFRCGLALYLLIIHGTTYYSHADLVKGLTTRLTTGLKLVTWADDDSTSLRLWITSVGLVTTHRTTDSRLFIDQAYTCAATLDLQVWEDVLVHLGSILWISSPQGDLFRHRWEEVLMVDHPSSVSEIPFQASFQVPWSREFESQVSNQTW